jgi:OOP family OmpA-OmpF porin
MNFLQMSSIEVETEFVVLNRRSEMRKHKPKRTLILRNMSWQSDPRDCPLQHNNEAIMHPHSHNMQRFRRTILAAVLGLGVAGMFGAAHAEGWYGGVGLGRSTATIDDASINNILMTVPGVTSVQTINKDELATGWKLFAGFKFIPTFAVEGGYVDLGTANLDTAITSISGTVTMHSKVKATGWNVDAVGFLPVPNNFALFARLGAIFPEVKLDLTGIGPGGPASASDKDTSTKAEYGLGFQADFSRTVALRGEWERYHKLGDKDKTGQSDVDLWLFDLVFNLK